MLPTPGIWLAKPEYVRLLAQGPEAAAAMGYSAGRGGFQKVGDVAIVTIAGLLSKNGGWFGASSLDLRVQIAQAAADPKISQILLRIDSPGGTAAGTQELANEVAAANKIKPVYAFIEDLGASAAYWVASQARKVFTNSMGIVGSIGTYSAVADMSQMAAKIGIKVHVIRAGEFKGAGTPGTEITAEQLGEWQRTVNALNEQFLRAVAAGRNLNLATVKKLGDGRAHVGKAALDLRLVDGITNMQGAFDALASATQSGGIPATTRSLKMDDDTIVAEYSNLVAEIMARNPAVDRMRANQIAAGKNPELHQAYVEASNRQVQAKRKKALTGR